MPSSVASTPLLVTSIVVTPGGPRGRLVLDRLLPRLGAGTALLSAERHAGLKARVYADDSMVD